MSRKFTESAKRLLEEHAELENLFAASDPEEQKAVGKVLEALQIMVDGDESPKDHVSSAIVLMSYRLLAQGLVAP